ncbi:CU044_2847 family protein [Streptomyces sp. NPDC059853]|uniref:CU044_2847 family protein n=1 Tax=Streptomyces sp. NPDC059853 TaxID=3346973 RepID=UPI00364EC2D1
MPAGRTGEPPAGRAARPPGSLLGVRRPVTETCVARSTDREHPPEEAGLAFGISRTAEAGVLLLMAAGEADSAVAPPRRPGPARR